MDQHQKDSLEIMMDEELEYLTPILKQQQEQNIVDIINQLNGSKSDNFSRTQKYLMEIYQESDDISVYYKFLLKSKFSVIASPILQVLIERFQHLENNGYAFEFVKLKFFIYCIWRYGEKVQYHGKNYYRIEQKIKDCLKIRQQEQQQTLQEQQQI